MKNVNLILVAIILAGVFYLSFTEKSPAKPEGGEYEVMVVIATLPTNPATINFYKERKEVEIIKVKGNSDEKMEEYTSQIQKLYNEGWEIESQYGNSSFVFKRKK